MPDNTAMTLMGVVLGFAHDAVSNDKAWDEVFSAIKEDRPDDPDFQGEDASAKLRAMVHAAVDTITEAVIQAETQLSQLTRGQRPAFPGMPTPPVPAQRADDPELDALIARQYL